MTQDELMEDLKAHDFRMGQVASTRWKVALALTNDSQTMVVLPRVRGVDLLITPLVIDQMLNPAGQLSVSMHRAGDRFVEYNYFGSETAIHRQILLATALFAQGQLIPDSYFKKTGIGPSERTRMASHAREEGSMSELYRAISNGDGESMYLEGGVWLHPDGSTRNGS